MASTRDKARQYLIWLLEAKHAGSAVERIERDLNRLVYTGTSQKISSQSKRNILELLDEYAREEPSLEDSDNYIISESIRGTSASDNSDILELISAMRRRVG